MATKKTTSAKPVPTSLDKRIKAFDDEMAKMRNRFQWDLSDAQTDLSRTCYADLAGISEIALATAMAALKQAPVYELMIGQFGYLGKDFSLLQVCGRMYLAGKMSPARIDSVSFDVNPPLTPDKI